MAALYGGDTEKKTRVSLMDIYPRGTSGAGNSNDQIGAGGSVPLVMKVPVSQTADCIEIQLANTVIMPSGGNPILWSVDLNGNGGYLGGVLGAGQKAIQFTMNATQIEGMFAAAFNLIPAPGAGLVIVVNDILVQTVPTATQFAAGGAVSFQYHGTAVVPHASTIPAATINSATGSYNLLPPITGVIQPPANTGIDITNATQAFTTGTGTVVVTIWYSILAA